MAYLKEHEDHISFTASVFYMSNADGEVQVEACDACDQMSVMCLHVNNEWNADGTVLTCKLCGVNGT